MNNNLSVFHDFKNSVKNKKQLANGDWKISGKVIYKWKGRIEEEVLPINIRLAGMEAGTIDIDDGDTINSDQDIHMRFNSAFKNPVFSITDDSVLKIKGTSAPQFGSYAYEVSIIAL